jgi:large subunit ribosomal protein L9
MKVLLLQRVPSLGNAGTIVEVADSYARNFLLPKKLASVATPDAIKKHQRAADVRTRDEQQRRSHQEKIFSTLSSLVLELNAAASPAGKLFAAVQERDIRGALARSHQLQLPTTMRLTGVPIKHTGESQVTIHGDDGASGILTVRISAL